VYGPHSNFLKWKPERSNEYVTFLDQDTLAQQKFYHAIASDNVEHAWSELKNWILRAAIQSGMTTAGTHTRPSSRCTPQAEWFDRSCLYKKQTYLDAAYHGTDPDIKNQLFHDYRSYAQYCKRRFFNMKRRTFLQKLFDNDPTVHRMLKKPAEKYVTPISEDAWSSHLHAVFRPTSIRCDEEEVERRCTVQQPPAATATESRVPPIQHDTNEQGLNDLPQEPSSLFGIPNETELFSLVSWHISSMPTHSSSGFDIISPAFIKNAYKCVPRWQGRGTESIHVLAPHIASFFHLLIRKARVPDAWKEAKLTPIYKKGPVVSPTNYRMIAVSAPIYRLYTNVLRSIIQDWCIHHRKIPDTQFGFYPGRSTLQPIFILRHLKNAAQKTQSNTSRLFTAFIDFQQAYDSIPREKLWKHLYRCQLPQQLIAILQDLYHMDEYTLLDGDKMASVQPVCGVKQGCPLSPLLFAIYLNDIDTVAEGVQGALTAIPNLTVTHLLFADDLAFTANKQPSLQKLLNNLKEYAMRKSLVVNTQKSQVMCVNSRSENLPTFFYDGLPLPYTDHFKYLGMVIDKQFHLSTAADAALQPLVNGTFKIQRFAQEHGLTNRLHALIWLLKTYSIPAGMYASQIWATPFLKQGKEMDNPLQKWIIATLKRWLGVRDTTPSWSVLRECGLEPLQFNWFRAAIRLYNSFTQCNSITVRKVLQADICLSSSSCDCWSSHIINAMDGLHHASQFKLSIMNCEPIYLRQFVVDLRSRQVHYWAQFSGPTPRQRNSKHRTYHHWCALPIRNIVATQTPYQTPKYFYLALPNDVLRNVARFRLRVHTLRYETSTWNQGSSSHCDLCQDVDCIQDEKHVIFHCTHPHVVALRAKYAFLFNNQEARDVRNFLLQDNNKLVYFIHEIVTFYEQASSRAF